MTDNNKIQASLTEQWKKGELPNGYYWIRLSWGGMVIMAYHTAFDGLFELDDHYYDSDEISEVLAPVPSYDELQNMNEAVNQAMSANIKLVEQNAQLKELLKECREPLEVLAEKRNACDWCPENLLAKIDEVLK